ncbi:MAG: MFS transporter [Streptosporangiales bacterium]|nr:MFS transporter [Streptosporangiales bacterium]
MRAGRTIDRWEPDDPAFWEETGARVARRNLTFSIFSEHLGFSIWTMWSVVTVAMTASRGFHFTVDQLFWLVSLPNLLGSLLRVPYTFMPAIIGGRTWTAVSAALLLIPTGLLSVALGDPDTPYWVFLAISATAGFGGGNFSSSMANITHFYPEKRQGWALGLNAAGGNIGVSSVQLLVPAAIAVFGIMAAGLMWIPLIVAAAVCAWLSMNNLSGAKADVREQLSVTRRAQTWVMSVIYIGTFGSFIGYSSAFPLLIKTQFPETGAAGLAFLGALVGSLSRPLGGRLADRIGGARVTVAVFAGMGIGVYGVWQALSARSFAGFLAAFLFLFVVTGLGNGSTYRMIPAIFRARALRDAPAGVSREAVLAAARRESSAALGLIGAVGALGGFLIPRSFGSSIAATGGVGAALAGFVVFYAVCLGLTWWCYLRKRVAVAAVPSLAGAGV